MRKNILHNAPLYLLTLANLAYAIQNGFDWLILVALCLSGIVLILDIVGGIQNGNKNH